MMDLFEKKVNKLLLLAENKNWHHKKRNMLVHTNQESRKSEIVEIKGI